jgi:hypothetical protein
MVAACGPSKMMKAVVGRTLTVAQLVEEFAAPLEYMRKNKVPVFCGEFGCVSDCPPP